VLPNDYGDEKMPLRGTTHGLRISSSQLTAGALRTESIWEMSVEEVARDFGVSATKNSTANEKNRGRTERQFTPLHKMLKNLVK
jgi:hypothetical protein